VLVELEGQRPVALKSELLNHLPAAIFHDDGQRVRPDLDVEPRDDAPNRPRHLSEAQRRRRLLPVNHRWRGREICLEAHRLERHAHAAFARRPDVELGRLAGGRDLLALAGDGADKQHNDDGDLFGKAHVPVYTRMRLRVLRDLPDRDLAHDLCPGLGPERTGGKVSIATPLAKSMARIFLSYRREDSRHAAERIYDRLCEHFGRKNVFKDVDSIRFGTDFRQAVQEAIGQADVLVVVIGTNWSRLRNESGSPRLSSEDDAVRVEIETALARSISMIPVLVDHAAMPKPKDLPASLESLAFRNAAPVRPDPDFTADIDRLIQAIHACTTEESEAQLRVLLIDEEPLHRKIGAAVLTSQRHACVAVGNPREATEAMEQGPFDLVLLQAHMKGSDAFELVASLRQKTADGSCPPMIGMTNDADRQRVCLKRGMDGVVSRPPTVPELQDVIDRFLFVINREQLLLHTGGSRELAREVIQTYLPGVTSTLTKIREAISTDDAPELATIAHVFKGTLQMLGAHSAREIASELESLGQSGKMLLARGVTQRLESALRRVQFSLVRILSDLNE
jgi:CheY-like chemotaxis protein